MKSAASLSRRSVLGLAALGLAACKKGPSASPPRVDPDADALALARDSEIQLLSATTDPAEQARHLQHLAALGGTPPTAIATPLTDDRSLRSRLHSSADMLRASAAGALNGTHAAVLASIAASHDVMARD